MDGGCVRGSKALLLLRKIACQAEQVTNSDSELLTSPWDSPLLRSFSPSPCSFSAAHFHLRPRLSLWGVKGVLDILWHGWHVKEQPDKQNTLSGQLMSHQIKGNSGLSVALMWCRDTAVTPEQCQDKWHTITQRTPPCCGLYVTPL